MGRLISRYLPRMRLSIVIPFGLALALGCSGSTPLAHFTLVSQEADASCSRVVDYCMRVTCTLKNDGPIPGQAVVDLELVGPGDAVVHTETERAELGPGDTRTLTHDFTDAKVGEEVQPRCVVR